MLSSRTITFLAAAVLIVAAVFVTTSMINLPGSVLEQPKTVSNAKGLAQYHQSEWALYPAKNAEVGMAQYHRSEWGVYESAVNDARDAGLAIYFNSERSIPIGSTDPFDKLRHDGSGR